MIQTKTRVNAGKMRWRNNQTKTLENSGGKKQEHSHINAENWKTYIKTHENAVEKRGKNNNILQKRGKTPKKKRAKKLAWPLLVVVVDDVVWVVVWEEWVGAAPTQNTIWRFRNLDKNK